VDERAHPVVGGHELALLGREIQRELVLARLLRDVIELERDPLAVDGDRDRRLGHGHFFSRWGLDQERHRDGDVDVAVNRDLGGEASSS